MKNANPKILIADDEAAITTGLGAILCDEGYRVDVVADGQKALERLSEDRVTVRVAKERRGRVSPPTPVELAKSA